MKKNYETPVAEKVEFQYQEQVVASSDKCYSVTTYHVEIGSGDCVSDDKQQVIHN